MTKQPLKPQKRGLLIDSDIVIKYLTGNTLVEKELNYLGASNNHIAQVGMLELFHNMEAKSTKALLEFVKNQKIIPLSETIGEIALSLVKGYPKQLKAADSLIAATARLYDLVLYTNNLKDFEGIAGLTLYKPNFHKLPL
jgi:predicted nucleic acid-binding protein